jgi:hypothetical protein
MPLPEWKHDFRYLRDGTYTNAVTVSHPFRRAGSPQRSTPGICPSCGLQRSAANRCDCNYGD